MNSSEVSYLLAICALIIVGNSQQQLPNQSVQRDPNTKLILWGTRHGNRNPDTFLEANPRQRTWGFEGDVELTMFGKRQGYGLGKSLRAFSSGFLSKNYLPTEAQFYSSSANRCQMTLQVALAGLYPPVAFADWNTALDWSPVPYSIDDAMLRMYGVKCPTSDRAWQPITDDNLPKLVALTNAKRLLLNYIAANTGWNASISSAADLADNIIDITQLRHLLYKTTFQQLNHAQFPAWIENPTLPGYDKTRLINEVLAFTENHPIECTEYPPCREMMGGVWLKNIVDNLNKADNGTGLKMIGYASHTEVTLSAMKLMGIDKDVLTTSAGFVLEYRDQPMKSIRLLNHDPNPIDQHVIYQAKYKQPLERLSYGNNWIPLRDFINFLAPKEILDWHARCGLTANCSSK